MFKWVDDEIEEIDEVSSNEAVQNDSNIAAFAVQLMEETKKKNVKLSKKLSAEKMKGKFVTSMLVVSVFLNLCLVAKLFFQVQENDIRWHQQMCVLVYVVGLCTLSECNAIL